MIFCVYFASLPRKLSRWREARAFFNIIRNSCPLWKLLPHDDFRKLKNFFVRLLTVGSARASSVGGSIDKVYGVDVANYFAVGISSFSVMVLCPSDDNPIEIYML